MAISTSTRFSGMHRIQSRDLALERVLSPREQPVDHHKQKLLSIRISGLADGLQYNIALARSGTMVNMEEQQITMMGQAN